MNLPLFSQNRSETLIENSAKTPFLEHLTRVYMGYNKRARENEEDAGATKYGEPADTAAAGADSDVPHD